MATELVTKETALQFPTQSEERHGKLIILKKNPINADEDDIPPNTPEGCNNSAASDGCWDVNVAVLLVVLAGLLILVLFYRVLLLRHKLRMAQAGNALEYFGFYHMAQYNLKDLHGPTDLPTVTHHVPEASSSYSPLQEVPPVTPPLLPLPSPPPPASLVPPPIIYTTPPSPQSDAEVYSRIGALRPSRLSSVSQSQVVLFEHSSL